MHIFGYRLPKSHVAATMAVPAPAYTVLYACANIISIRIDVEYKNLYSLECFYLSN